MKKTLKALPVLALGLSSVVALAQEGDIHVVSREDGSGTRSAFVEIVGVVDENEDDATVQTATIQNGTTGVMQTVAGDVNAIGYISLGSLDDTVKALTVDGAEATADAINAGDYAIARPFNIAWNAENGLSEVAQDFVDFINSQEGQTIVEAEGYIAVNNATEGDDAAESTEETSEEAESVEETESAEETEATEETEAAEEESTEESEEETTEAAEGDDAASDVISQLPNYEATGVAGDLTIVGSTSVAPLIEVLAEEYQALNPDVTVNVTANGSSAGVQAAIEGAADLGMASREIEEEEAASVDSQAIALDGIAVIVNPDSTLEDISLDNVREIFLGNVTTWEEVAQ